VVHVVYSSISIMPPQPDLPPGRTYRCDECGTRLRSGQPHSALEPTPHQTLLAMEIREEAAA